MHRGNFLRETRLCKQLIFEQDFTEDSETRGERSGWTNQRLDTTPVRTYVRTYVLPTSTFDGFEVRAKMCVPYQVHFATGDPHLRKQKKQLVDFDRTTCQNLLQAMSFEATRQALEKRVIKTPRRQRQFEPTRIGFRVIRANRGIRTSH